MSKEKYITFDLPSIYSALTNIRYDARATLYNTLTSNGQSLFYIYGNVTLGGYKIFLDSPVNDTKRLTPLSSYSTSRDRTDDGTSGGSSLGAHPSIGNLIWRKKTSPDGWYVERRPVVSSIGDAYGSADHADCDSGIPGVSVSSAITNLDAAGFLIDYEYTGLTSGGYSLSGGTYSYEPQGTDIVDQYYTQVYVLAANEISKVTSVTIDGVDYPVNTSTGELTGYPYHKIFCFTHTGGSDQKTSFILSKLYPETFTEFIRLANVSYAVLVGRNGFHPHSAGQSIFFNVAGKNLYDPRTATTGSINDNPVLALYDFLTDANLGLAIPASLLDDISFSAAANICEQSVSLTPSGSEDRYTISALFDATLGQEEILTNICNSFAGRLFMSNGQLKTIAGATTSSSVSLTTDDMVSELVLSRGASLKNLFNGVYGQYSGSTGASEYPLRSSASYLAKDNNISKLRKVDFPFTNSETTAQRLSKIWLIQNRSDLAIKIKIPLKYLDIEVGDTIDITSSRLSWTNRKFLVMSTTIMLYDEPGITLELQDLDTDPFDWTAGTDTIANVETAITAIASSTTPPLSAFSVSDTDYTTYSTLTFNWTAPTSDYISDASQIEINFLVRTYESSSSTTITNTKESIYFNLNAGTTGEVTCPRVSSSGQDVLHFRARVIDDRGIASSWLDASADFQPI